MKILENEPLSGHTTYRIGGPARFLAYPEHEEDLNPLLNRIRESSLPYVFIGQGSNLLVSDSGYRGWVIGSREYMKNRIGSLPGTVDLSSSVPILSLLKKCEAEGAGGLEFLAGIPGSLGGAVFMNAGSQGGEISSWLEEVRVFSFRSGETEKFNGQDLRFEYRKNLFLSPDHFITVIRLKTSSSTSAEVKKKIRENLEAKRKTQPLDAPSCGSVFKNPAQAGLTAWQVIEKLGLRRHTIGGAQVSEKHCNFIVNCGGARARDVKELMDLIRHRARSELGVELEAEVRMLGFEHE